MQFRELSQEELKFWILLSKTPSLGPIRCHKLLERFGSPKEIFSAPLEELTKIPKIDEKTIRFIKEEVPYISLRQDYELIRKLKIKLIPFSASFYPANLRNIPDPPFLLYERGELERSDENSVAIVGTRKATNYGKIVARKLARELAREGITVISGMARGIDTAAHEGALEEGGRTIAVLGCGVDVVYPPENDSLMREIIEKGAVISEFPLGEKPLAQNFPRRNRIISGLSRGVLVVEAPSKSGALTTADFALEQGREVFAVPGSITNPYCRGSNKLIKEGAKMVEDVSDILEELGFYSIKKEKISSIDPQISFEEKIILNLLSSEPIHIDELIEKTQLSVPKVADILIRLQMKGMIRELPGKLFVKEV